MDDSQESGQKSWWEDTLDFVVRAAATKRYAAPQLSNGQSYYVDPNGNVLPMGQAVQINPALAANTAMQNPMVMLAVVALGAALLFKLVK